MVLSPILPENGALTSVCARPLPKPSRSALRVLTLLRARSYLSRWRVDIQQLFLTGFPPWPPIPLRIWFFQSCEGCRHRWFWVMSCPFFVPQIASDMLLSFTTCPTFFRSQFNGFLLANHGARGTKFPGGDGCSSAGILWPGQDIDSVHSTFCLCLPPTALSWSSWFFFSWASVLISPWASR